MIQDDDPSTRLCPGCGASLPRGNSPGSCPVCLFDLGCSTNAPTLDEARGDWLEAAETSSPNVPAAMENCSLDAGTTFGTYELLGEIARGGMGIVYRARQRQPRRLVALKVLLPRQVNTANVLARFRAEAAMVASLDHPNVLPVYEAGERDGLPFFSMKLIEGGSLAGRVHEYAGRPRAAARLVRLAAEALHHAHQRGILHRDLKPGNILLHGEGSASTPFVTDFGIAKLLDHESALTLTHDVLGTPAYAAPEQASPGLADVTTAADVYGLGAVLYELLAQRPPFAGATPLETLRQVVDEPPSPPRFFDPDIPRDLETICLKCLQKDPHARYASAAGLAADLGRFLAGETVLARPVSTRERVWRWARRNPALGALWTTLALFVVTVAVGSTAAAWRLEVQKARAVQAERATAASRNEAIEHLRASYLVGAHALRGTAQAGHRFEALSLLRKAAAIRPGFDLRNEAIAALSLTDVALEKNWKDAKATMYGPAAFDPTLRFCASALDMGQECVWSFADRRRVGSLDAADPDGTRARTLGPWNGAYLPLITAAGTVRLYQTDPATGKATLAFSLPGWAGAAVGARRPGRVAFAPDGKTMALCVTDGDGVSLRNPADGRETARVAATQHVDLVAFTADGKQLVLAAGFKREARRWDVARDRQECLYKVDGDVLSLAVAGGGRFVAFGTDDAEIRLFDLASGEPGPVLRCRNRGSEQLAFNHRGDVLASTGRDAALRLWDPSSGELLVHAPGLTAEPALRFSSDDARIGISPYPDGAIAVARLAGGDCLRVLKPPGGSEPATEFCALDISPDGRLLAAATPSGVFLADLRCGRALAWWEFDAHAKKTVQFAADGRSLIVASLTSGRWQRELTWKGTADLTWGPPKHLDDTAGYLQTSPPTRDNVAAFVRDKTGDLLVRPVDAAGPPVEARDHFPLDIALEGRAWQAILSRDGRWLATAVDGELPGPNPACKVWEAATHRLVHRLPSAGGSTVTFSPGGRYFYASTAEAPVLETGSWRQVLHIPYETDDAVFSPDDRCIALRDDSSHDGNQGTVRLFALPGGEPLAVFESAANHFVFSPDGRYLAGMETGGTLYLWDLHAFRRELRGLGLDWGTEPLPGLKSAPAPIFFHEP